MDAQDRRVKRTQRLLAKALITLTLEKGYDLVTIRDITERADVGYATFFRHYADKEALLREVSEVVLTELTELLPTATNMDPATIGMLIFRYIEEHHEIIQTLLSSRTAHASLQLVIQQGIETIVQQYRPRQDTSVPADVAAFHLITSSIALIQWWLNQGMPYPPERMGIIYRDLVIEPTIATAFEIPSSC